MSPRVLEAYLHRQIPLSRAMQVAVLDVGDERVVLGAPLGPNVNHRATVFGGSASALAILAAWSLLYVRLTDRELAVSLVIQRNSISYERPMAGNFTASATLAETERWPQFLRTLTRRGKARIAMTAQLRGEGEEAGHFGADFVAFAIPLESAGG
jgi:thioesterase domain-containing protein